MKKMLLLAILSAIAGLVNLHGQENMNNSNNAYGYQKYGKEFLNSFEGNGMVLFEDTKVFELAQINGSLKAHDSTINSLQVNGQTDLLNCVIINAATINGSLNAEKTKFQDLLVSSKKIVLKMCIVNSLTMKKTNGYDGPQIIDLSNGTKVLGPIIVESGNGEIWVSSNSEISENQVSGAQVYRK